MAYKVQLPDGSWHNTDDLTGFEVEAISDATGTPWSVLNPFRNISDYRAIVTAFAARDEISDADIIEWFKERSLRSLDEGLKIAGPDDDDRPTEYEDGIPLAEGGTSTTSSATSPDHPSDGPQT